MKVTKESHFKRRAVGSRGVSHAKPERRQFLRQVGSAQAARRPFRNFWRVLLATGWPNFNSSPRMRSVPHRLLSLAMRRMSATFSLARAGRPIGIVTLDLPRYTHPNNSRCQRSSVSGFTMSKVSFRVFSRLASTTNKARSRQVSVGRFT
jgi:hypothetical protein